MTVSFLDAKPGQCRFPPASEVPSPTMLYCGEATAEGSSFCPACRKIVYAGTPKMRDFRSESIPRDPSEERDTTPDLVEAFS